MNTPSHPELSDEAVQAMLAKESVRGPRLYRGRPLAPYSAGARDLVLKVVSPTDNASFHDCVVCHVLAELHADEADERLARRRTLIVATDDPDTFRARFSLEVMDELSDADIFEARRLVTEILTPVDQAKVAVAIKPGKKGGASKARNPSKSTP